MNKIIDKGEASVPVAEWKFSDILADPLIRERWQKVRKWFFLRESTYDMTNRCNIRCDGCYYYEGDKQFAPENSDLEAWRRLMQAEKKRGITYVVLAGAEPALVAELCEVCYQEMPLGAIATNGLKAIPPSIRYRIHISVWGSDETSLKIRKAKNMLLRQLDNYGNDPRAVFVYTFTRENIEQARPIADRLAAAGCRLTFNMFSAPVGFNGNLRHTAGSLEKCRNTMVDLLERYPDTVLFSRYNAVVHTHSSGLHHLFSCSLPPHESVHRDRARTVIPTVSDGPHLESQRGLLCSGHRLRRLPPLRRRKRRGHGPDVSTRNGSRHFQGLARLRGHVSCRMGHGV